MSQTNYLTFSFLLAFLFFGFLFVQEVTRFFNSRSTKWTKETVFLPRDESEFEALLLQATTLFDLPLDDSARMVFCSYVHSLSREQNTTTAAQVGAALHKMRSNALTDEIYRAINAKRKAEQDAASKAGTEGPKIVPSLDEDETTAG